MKSQCNFSFVIIWSSDLEAALLFKVIRFSYQSLDSFSIQIVLLSVLDMELW